jgi:hypothetical protein
MRNIFPLVVDNDDDTDDYRAKIGWCLENHEFLNSWEVTFLHGMLDFETISPRQHEKLKAILTKVRWGLKLRAAGRRIRR